MKNFTGLASRGYYNDTTIHRIIPGERQRTRLGRAAFLVHKQPTGMLISSAWSAAAGFMVQAGDPTGTGRGGESIWGGERRANTADSTMRVLLCTVGCRSRLRTAGQLWLWAHERPSAFAGKFEDEIHPGLKHTGAGILSMVRQLEWLVCTSPAAVEHGRRANSDSSQRLLEVILHSHRSETK